MDEVVKVLYISYDGLTDPLGQSQVLPYLIVLSKRGFEFTVLSFEKKEKLEREGAIIRKLTTEAKIRWVPLSFTTRPPILSKIYDRHRMWRTALLLHRQHQFQLTHCRSYVSAEVGLRMKKQFGTKMLFDMRGFWADEKIDNGQWDLSNPIYKQIYKHYKEKEKAFLLEADGIISLTHAAKDYLLNQPLYRHLPIEVIPCCADLAHFNYANVSEAEKEEVRSKLDLPDGTKVITYVGSFGGWYMTKEMFAFVKLLQQKHPEYFFLFLTKDEAAKVVAEANEAGIDTTKLRVLYVNRQELPAYLSISNCSIFFIRNTFSKLASSPTKHAELMGMGIPVVCNTIGDTGNIITQTGTGQLVDQFDEQTLRHAVDQLPKTENLDAAFIRDCGADLFDLKTGVEKYFDMYQKILSTKKQAAFT